MNSFIEPVTTIVPPTRATLWVDGPGSGDRPLYQHVGGGRFLPANPAADAECAAWNAYADAVNARTANRSAQL